MMILSNGGNEPGESRSNTESTENNRQLFSSLEKINADNRQYDEPRSNTATTETTNSDSRQYMEKMAMLSALPIATWYKVSDKVSVASSLGGEPVDAIPTDGYFRLDKKTAAMNEPWFGVTVINNSREAKAYIKQMDLVRVTLTPLEEQRQTTAPQTSLRPLANQANSVWITNTGQRYHNSGCRHLDQSRISISLPQARSRGYTACLHCHP